MTLSRRHFSKSGYILVATSLGLVFLLGAAGLTIDIGRMYITKNEAQAFVDSAAIAAARMLDDSGSGITKAQAAVGADTGKWRFDTSPFTNVSTGFSTAPTGPFVATPPNPPTSYYFARVTVSVNLPMYFIRVLAGPTATVAASAVAGRSAITSYPGGEFPFSPYSRKFHKPDDAADPYGFKIGNEYTLHWGSPGDKSTCGTGYKEEDKIGRGAEPGDQLALNGNIRAYCCAGNASDAREAIVGLATVPLTIGQAMPMDNAERRTLNEDIAGRVLVDSDTTSVTFDQYFRAARGNRARVVMVPVNSGPPNYLLVGFAGFFLENANKYLVLNGNDAACGEYLGVFIQGAPPGTASGSGAYRIRLYE